MQLRRSMRLVLATLILGITTAGFASHIIAANVANVFHYGADQNGSPSAPNCGFGPGKSVKYRKSGIIILTSNANVTNQSGRSLCFPNLGCQVYDPEYQQWLPATSDKQLLGKPGSNGVSRSWLCCIYDPACAQPAP